MARFATRECAGPADLATRRAIYILILAKLARRAFILRGDVRALVFSRTTRGTRQTGRGCCKRAHIACLALVLRRFSLALVRA
jgi:hypothetical protein